MLSVLEPITNNPVNSFRVIPQPMEQRADSAPKIFLVDDKRSAVIKLTDKALSKHLTERMDILRFVAICSVVWGHCLLGLEHNHYTDYTYQIIQSVLLESGRVGTVVFFLISGFLLQGKINQFTVVSYLRYRLFSIIIPWMIFVTSVVLIQIFQNMSLHEVIWGNKAHTLNLALNLFKAAMFHAAYWFIPVAIVSGCILVAFKNQVNKVWFGLMLASFTLFYSINLYHGWISANHTKAVLGYLLFMWLGKQIKRKLPQVIQIVKSFSWTILVPVLIVAFALACREGKNLSDLGCDDPYASIRFSNAIFSILLFFAFIKSTRLRSLRRFNPKKNTYGIYLIHCVIIISLMPLINHSLENPALYSDFPKMILVKFVFFLVILGLSLFFVKLIRKSPLYFILGRKN